MPQWLEELEAGGHLGKPFSWAPDGTCQFEDPVTLPDRQAIEAIFAGHPDEQPFTLGPPPPVPPPAPAGATPSAGSG
jgi:hypothetical protein